MCVGVWVCGCVGVGVGVGVGACMRACVRVLAYSVHYPWVCLYALTYNAESMACVQW